MFKKPVLAFLIMLVAAKSYSQCPVTEILTANPQPVNGTYLTCQTVTFCYSLQGWTEYGNNYLHGLLISLGPGWDTTTFTTISLPGSCDGEGSWGLFKKDVSVGSGKTFGWGYYYDKPVGFAGVDGIPGNNYGDHTATGTCVWNFCFSIKVKSICNGSDLSVAITATGDGTTGAWGNISCQGIPVPGPSAVCKPECNLALTVTPSKAACAVSNGTVTSNFSGSCATPFKYAWNSGQKTPHLSGLNSGTYSLTVTDGNQCSISASTIVTVNNPVAITTSTTDVSCFGFCDGTATILPTAGQAPYTYFWQPYGSTQKIAGLCAGTYSVVVSDANNCTKSGAVAINQFINLILTSSSTPASCNGGSDGTASVTASFGNTPYTYKWFNGSQNATVSNLKAGVYHATVTDAKGCYLDIAVSVNEPQPININPVIKNVSCFGLADGFITLAPSMGVTPYSYHWASGESVNSVSNLASGLYNVTVTDYSACYIKAAYFITQPPSFGGAFRQQPASCPEASDGSAEVVAYGGVTPYSYLWKTIPVQTTSKVTNLVSGTYTVQVADQNGCKLELTDEVKALPLFKADAGSDQEIQKFHDSHLLASVNRPGNYSIAWTPISNLNDPQVVNPIASPKATTTYILTIINLDNGCRASDSVVITVLPTDYLYVPNAFSPNQDGINDLFFPIPGDLIQVIDFKVFNRWGQEVFNGPDGAWDGRFRGRDESEGSYAYYVIYKNVNAPDKYLKQGSVTLMR